MVNKMDNIYLLEDSLNDFSKLTVGDLLKYTSIACNDAIKPSFIAPIITDFNEKIQIEFSESIYPKKNKWVENDIGMDAEPLRGCVYTFCIAELDVVDDIKKCVATNSLKPISDLRVIKVGQTSVAMHKRIMSYNCGQLQYRLNGSCSTTNYGVLQNIRNSHYEILLICFELSEKLDVYLPGSRATIDDFIKDGFSKKDAKDLFKAQNVTSGYYKEYEKLINTLLKNNDISLPFVVQK